MTEATQEKKASFIPRWGGQLPFFNFRFFSPVHSFSGAKLTFAHPLKSVAFGINGDKAKH